MCVKFDYMLWTCHVSDCSDFVPVLVSSPVFKSATTMKNVAFVFLSILILPWARMHHADYCPSTFKVSRLFWMMISRLNCPPLPDHVSVELYLESWVERENDAIYSQVYFCNVWTQVIRMGHELLELNCCCAYQIGSGFTHTKMNCTPE